MSISLIGQSHRFNHDAYNRLEHFIGRPDMCIIAPYHYQPFLLYLLKPHHIETHDDIKEDHGSLMGIEGL